MNEDELTYAVRSYLETRDNGPWPPELTEGERVGYLLCLTRMLDPKNKIPSHLSLAEVVPFVRDYVASKRSNAQEETS